MHRIRLFNPLKALAGGWLILLLLSTTSQAHVVFNALNRAKGMAGRVGPTAFTHTLAGPLASGGSLTVGGGFQSAGGIGGLLARTDANGSAFYHADGAGNITALSDGMESIAARYLYSPFGRITTKSGPLADANVMQFSSMPWLARSGLSLYPFRAYDPGLQRWLNRDLIGEIGGMNVYRFVGNNPISNVDPLGLEGNPISSTLPGLNGRWNSDASGGAGSFYGPGFYQSLAIQQADAEAAAQAAAIAAYNATVPSDFQLGADGYTHSGIETDDGTFALLAPFLAPESAGFSKCVHGNSLRSMRPTWGYKLYSGDGTFLKNGITSKVVPESR